MSIAEFLANNPNGGIKFENGNIDLGFEESLGATGFKLTTKELEDLLVQAFGAMMGQEDAEALAKMWLGYISTTSAGATLEANDAEAAVNTYINQTA